MNPLVTDEQFASYLQRDLDRATADLALAGASGLVRDYCRWSITQETTTFVIDGNATRLLTLPTLKLTDVTEVRVGGIVLDPDDYAWSESGMLASTGNVWPQRFRYIEVDCTHGHEQTPDAVALVTFSLGARYYVNPEGLRSKAVGGVSRSFVIETLRGDLFDLEAAMLGPYRLP